MDYDLYQEELMDHYRHPHNNKKVLDANFASGEYNPSCGDKMHIEGIIENNVLTQVGFQGKGCVISQAAASMLTEHCKGKTVDEILEQDKETVTNLIGMPLGPNRLKCALLCLEVIQKGILEFKNNSNSLKT